MYKIFNIVVFTFIFSNCLFSQISTSSPYSRFGLGELNHNVLPEYNAFGGASIALSSSTSINPNNPASFVSFASNSFLFSTGGWHKTTKLDNGNENQISNNTGFGHLVLGFPLAKKIGSSFGMIPYSSTGYVMHTRNLLYNADMSYYGDGGLTKVYFGSAYKDLNGFSIGINASYLFGGLNRRKQLIYDDESFLNSRSNDKVNLKGYYYELGVLYKKELNENDAFTLGVTVNNESTIKAKRTVLIESFEFSGSLEVPQDTFFNSIEWGDVTLPKCISAGITYSKNKQWLILADYSLQNWSDYSMFNESDNLVNSMKICGGIEYTPDYNSITKYYKRINYRLGASYSNIPLQFEDNQLNEISFSFGFGIPLKKSRTKYDFACTIGQRGTTDDNLIKEQFVRFGLSISYDGIWFVKRKYD